MHLLNFVLMIWWIPKSSHDLGYDLYFPGNVWGHTCGLAICDVLLEQVETKVLPLPPSISVCACMHGCHMFLFYYAVCVIHFFLLILACVYDLLLIYQVQFFKWSSFIGSRIISTYSIFKGIKYIDIVSVNLMFKNASSWYFFSPPAQHYNGDISELELYFVIVNNEYGEQCEEELLPGGRDMRVTNDNVITFIHLVANHRLNYQVKILLVCYFLAWECFAQ